MEHPVIDVQSYDILCCRVLQIPMIIEFFGAPGAGKSTMTLAARQILSDMSIKAMLVPEAGRCCLKRVFLGRMICLFILPRWQDRALWGVFRRLIVYYRLKFAINNMTLVWRVVGVLARRRLPWRDKRLIFRLFLRDGSYYQFFQDRLRPDEALILQEGLVHRATSLFASASEKPIRAEIAYYTELLPRSNLSIWVHTSPDICVARVCSRGVYRRYLGKDLTPFVANSAKVLELALHGLEKRGWDIIEVNNDERLDVCEADLRDLLTIRFSG